MGSYHLALPLLSSFRYLPCVAARVLCILVQLGVQKGGTKALHLPLHGRPYVEGLHHSPEALCGGDCLQASNPGPYDEYPGWAESAGGRR